MLRLLNWFFLFQVLVVATDRSPDRPLSTTATVVVNVERNVPPQILNPNSYIKTISESIEVTEVIDTIEANDANPAVRNFEIS